MGKKLLSDAAKAPLNTASPGLISPGLTSSGAASLRARFSEWLQSGMTAPVAADPKSRELFALAAQVAAGRSTVLITGPSGAGKEIMARYLHDKSKRHDQAFLALNCAALPEAMLESLLFGHERGAFTGAQTASEGLFRAADGGTLFLDEIGELPLTMQAKLLRAVELGEVLPLGAAAPVQVDVRLLAATNRDLSAEVDAGRFRADLYWRLSVFPLAIPALAERPADILPLAALMLQQQGQTRAPSEAALQMLLRHDWPGNVRELGNVLERATILSDGAHIDEEHILIEGTAQTKPTLADSLRRSEAQALRSALAEAAGRRTEAARLLGISERTLRYKLAALAGRPRGRSVPAATHDGMVMA